MPPTSVVNLRALVWAIADSDDPDERRTLALQMQRELTLIRQTVDDTLKLLMEREIGT
jgi:hypothetical protein